MLTVFRRFPAQVALGALLLYGLTLSHGVTAGSLSLTAKVAGWDWIPMTGQPLLWLLTLPLRLLPAGWVPAGLNLFSAILAAVTLGILARSLELLPWFQPWLTLKGWSARLPLLLAVAGCGLEFNFWQEATAATGEMLDVLLLAAALWCGLEYGVEKNVRWLQAAAFVWGLGMAESWVMLFALPLFVGALVWLRKLQFFRIQFILSMAILGLAGFAVYALLPTANGLSPGSPLSLGASWLHSLRETKSEVSAVYTGFWVRHRLVSFAILLFYLITPLVLLTRFGDENTKNKSSLDRTLIGIFRGVRVGLLLVCLWLALDPLLGPRQILLQQLKVALPLLSFDYLNALCVGFLAGNLLLIQPRVSASPRRTFRKRLALWLHRAAMPAMTVLLVVIVLGLALRNLPAIVQVNRQPLNLFGELALRSLPAGGGIVVSDSPQKLSVFQAALARQSNHPHWLPVDISALPLTAYRERLERLSPGGWLTPTNRHDLNDGEMLELMNQLAQTNRVFYLHPSFGYFYEYFYQDPTGSVFEFKRLKDDAISPPPLEAPATRDNEKFWDELLPRITFTPSPDGGQASRPVRAIERLFRLTPAPGGQDPILGEWYSMALNSWGVELQRNGLLPAAQKRFNQALLLNTNNWIARINLICNTNLQSGAPMSLADMGSLAGQIGTWQKLSLFMSHMGPLDEPASCYLLGEVSKTAGLRRLALQQFDRARELAPDTLAPGFALAELYGSCRMDDQAMRTIDRLRVAIKKQPDHASLDVKLSVLEAKIWMAQTNKARASGVLQTAVQQDAGDPEAVNQISLAYLAFGDLNNAEKLVAQKLGREPENVSALLIESAIFIQSQRASLAIPVLNQVLSLTNNAQARFNRAIAYAMTGDYAAAQADYSGLEKLLPNPFLAAYGLAQVAELQHDTNEAVHYLKICLSNSVSDTLQSQRIRAQLDSLQPSATKK